MSFIIKLLFILGMAILPAIPFVLEYVSFRRELRQKSRVSALLARRLGGAVYRPDHGRSVPCAGLFAWLESVSFVRQLVSALAIGERTVYFGKVIVALLVNFAIGMLYWLACRVIRAALCKSSLVEPAKKDGEFSFAQKLERRAVAFFHQEVFFFVGKILRYLSIALSAAYILFFIVCQIRRCSARRGSRTTSFPCCLRQLRLSEPRPDRLLVADVFLLGCGAAAGGVSAVPAERAFEGKKVSVDLESLNRELKKCFRDFYVGEIKVPGACDKKAAASHLPVDQS